MFTIATIEYRGKSVGTVIVTDHKMWHQSSFADPRGTKTEKVRQFHTVFVSTFKEKPLDMTGEEFLEWIWQVENGDVRLSKPRKASSEEVVTYLLETIVTATEVGSYPPGSLW